MRTIKIINQIWQYSVKKIKKANKILIIIIIAIYQAVLKSTTSIQIEWYRLDNGIDKKLFMLLKVLKRLHKSMNFLKLGRIVFARINVNKLKFGLTRIQ
jgi:hypothetical protein